MNTAQTILSQIKTLDARALWAWGAKDLVNMGNGLQFKTSGMCKWKGQVYVKYNEATDLYDIQFFRLLKAEVKTDCKMENVFAEDLVKFIDAQVG
jgi:hypothetical protein